MRSFNLIIAVVLIISFAGLIMTGLLMSHFRETEALILWETSKNIHFIVAFTFTFFVLVHVTKKRKRIFQLFK
jgi:thiosulfate reductase cytochrome b subunit